MSGKKLEDIAKELGVKPKIIRLKEGEIKQIGKNLFVRKTGKEIEIFEGDR